MEQNHVHSVYSLINKHFSDTRVAIWNCVELFLNKLPLNSLIGIDVGCGNGKYEKYTSTLTQRHMIACDICPELVSIASASASKSTADFLLANGLNIPFVTNSFDFAISIAVIHHLSTHTKRLTFLREIIRCSAPNAMILITAWAAEQPIKKKWQHLGNNDYLIPWTDKFTKETHYRYYHLFSREYVDQLLTDIETDCNVTSVCYECDNWCIELQKKNICSNHIISI